MQSQNKTKKSTNRYLIDTICIYQITFYVLTLYKILPNENRTCYYHIQFPIDKTYIFFHTYNTCSQLPMINYRSLFTLSARLKLF